MKTQKQKKDKLINELDILSVKNQTYYKNITFSLLVLGLLAGSFVIGLAFGISSENSDNNTNLLNVREAEASQTKNIQKPSKTIVKDNPNPNSNSIEETQSTSIRTKSVDTAEYTLEVSE